ncbi:MAG: hypothetical protein ACXU9D_11085, partial [Xanthobacteraceae bacterium]
MADYYPLISRAVAGLEKNNGENRRALYERARAALLAQLRGVTPALNESDITRERLALEESIRKVEAESARQFVEASRQARAAKVRSIEPRSTLSRPSALPPDLGRQPGAPSPPPTLPDAQQSDSIFDRPLRPEPSLRQPPRRFGAEPRAFSDAGLGEAPFVAKEAGAASARADTSGREMFGGAPTPDIEGAERPYDRPELDGAEPRMFDPHAPQERMFDPHAPQGRALHDDFSEPMLEPAGGFDDSHSAVPQDRRAPPPPIDDDLEFEEELEEETRPPRSYRNLIKAGVVALVFIAVGGLLLWQWPNMVALYSSFRSPAVETVRDTPPANNTRPKITDRIEPGTPQAPATPAPGALPGAGAAQKVVLYEEDPADPNGKRFVGSAIWRTETVTPGPGQPPELAVRADVEVPERKLAMTWSFRRNTDKGLPATHTVEITFKLPPDFPAGGISNVPGILMKQAEQTRGVPLAGLAVKVTPGFYLVGLSNQEADKERNLQLLKERGWFDIPVVYNNNRRAILAMEKGSPGERAFAEAFK